MTAYAAYVASGLSFATPSRAALEDDAARGRCTSRATLPVVLVLGNSLGQTHAHAGLCAVVELMQKLLLLSLMFATIALPARAARMKNPRAGFRRMVIYMLAFDAFYLIVLRFLYAPT